MRTHPKSSSGRSAGAAPWSRKAMSATTTDAPLASLREWLERLRLSRIAGALGALGADLEQVLRTPDGRPVRTVNESAKPIREILQS